MSKKEIIRVLIGRNMRRTRYSLNETASNLSLNLIEIRAQATQPHNTFQIKEKSDRSTESARDYLFESTKRTKPYSKKLHLIELNS